MPYLSRNNVKGKCTLPLTSLGVKRRGSRAQERLAIPILGPLLRLWLCLLYRLRTERL
jgi:hypothetical protein